MKKLRGQTIVPTELYVRRRADEQLAQIIKDMGRPGYVLVARQMGKTNLLLNARRESPVEDMFVYLDVSNVFPDERSFFRNIIDVAVESMGDRAALLSEQISSDRTASELLPHKEHERELRRLLQAVPGRLVVCLDEIDALTKTSYSDQIFSYIRSVYFSGRANFPEFARLTYVLSGVAEPSDLIKNRAISPFNIGEKIYLDDFTFEEVRTFVSLAEIALPEGAIEAVYSWTSGHPRMTWDLLAALDPDAMVAAHDVEQAVRQLYFSSVDVPPVDHIKALVESSREVRDALVAIHYGKTESISDGARTKLYLAGISRFDPDTRKVSFKNRILELALSEEFLVSLDRMQPTFEAALRSIGAKNYEEAYSAFLGFVRANPEDSRVHQARYWAGVASYYLGNYSEAVAQFSSPSSAKLPVASLVARYFFHGMSMLRLGDKRSAMGLLTEAVRGGLVSDYPATYFEAQVVLSTLLIETIKGSSDPRFDEAVRLSRSLIGDEEGASTVLSALALRSLLLQAHVNLAKAANLLQAREQALKLIDGARRHADAAANFRLHLVEYELTPEREARAVVLQKSVQALKEVRVFDAEAPAPGEGSLLDEVGKLLKALSRTEKAPMISQVVDHVLSHLSGKSDIYDFVSVLVVDLFHAGKHQIAREIVDRAIAAQAARGPGAAQKSLLSLAILSQESEADRYGDQYLSLIEGDEPSVDDLRFIAAVSSAALNHANAIIARRGVAAILRVESLSETEPAASCLRLLQDYFQLLYRIRFEGEAGLNASASALIRKLAAMRSFSLTLFPEQYHRIMQSELARRLRALGPVAPLRRGRKYGRNDVVVVEYDGVRRRGKYKFFAQDLEKGACRIVET
jgi:tetratricopeptide (TPR) repeat protein